MNFDLMALDDNRRKAVKVALKVMTFPPGWEVDRTIKVINGGGPKFIMDVDNPTILLPPVQQLFVRPDGTRYKRPHFNFYETARQFSHECGHADDLFFLTWPIREKIMELREWPPNQPWASQPTTPKWDQPREWYAEAFSAAYFGGYGKRWTEWGEKIKAIREGL